MSAARFRPPTKHRAPENARGTPLTKTVRSRVGFVKATKDPASFAVLRGEFGNRVATEVCLGLHGPVHAAEPMVPTPLRRSRKGLVNVPRKQQAAIRRDLKRKREAGKES